MTTWINSQFPRPDFHRQVQRHYGLQDTRFPSVLDAEQKYSLLKSLWRHVRKRRALRIAVSSPDQVAAAIEAVKRKTELACQQELPPEIEKRLAWLSDNDFEVAKRLLKDFEAREAAICCKALSDKLGEIFRLVHSAKGYAVTGTSTVELPWGVVEIHVTPMRSPQDGR